MTPQQAIKHVILALHGLWNDIDIKADLTGEEVDALYQETDEEYCLGDAREEVREGDHETTITPHDSRHYETKSVAAQAPNGQWVGWTYYYGGGKHGEPSAYDWQSNAYLLNCQEEQVTVTKRTFTQVVPA
jgi:hypothetical protein